VYYVKVATRGQGTARRGSPRQALDYLTDGHDERREPGYSDAELAYIARLDEGWKTDLEGGRVPLVGLGTLESVADQATLREAFEDSCLPRHRCGTIGYKSITLTVPKELSLFADGHREIAKEAIYAAARSALERAYPGLHYTAVAAVHTRNESGEIHHHVHVLVGKFALEKDGDRVVSLNGKRAGNGPETIAELKRGWKEGIDREFRERLGLKIEQRTPNAAPAIVLPTGERIEPLNRASRRVLEKEIAPTFAAAGPKGGTVQRTLHLSAMDDRIFEIASGRNAGWSATDFKTAFPEQARFIGRYEKRVETLRQVGYLSPEGRPTKDFRVHFAVRHGINTPDLQRLRIDLANAEARRERRDPAGARGRQDFWRDVQRVEHFRKRVERLGYSPAELEALKERAAQSRPTPESLRAIKGRAIQLAMVRKLDLPTPKKTVIRAFLDVQAAKAKPVSLVVSGAVSLNLRENAALAAKLREASLRDYLRAKDRAKAAVALKLRPVWGLVQIALPSHARDLERSVMRCARLAYSEEIRRLQRDEVQRAYRAWRQVHLERPREDLRREAKALERPIQTEHREKFNQAQDRLALRNVETARDQLTRGMDAMRGLNRPEATTLAAWRGREGELVQAVFETAKARPGSAQALSQQEQAAALRAGQMGRLLAREAAAPSITASMDPELKRLAARLHAFDIPFPLGPNELRTVAAKEVGQLLSGAKAAGLLSDEPSWVLRAKDARETSVALRQLAERSRDADEILTDTLLKGLRR